MKGRARNQINVTRQTERERERENIPSMMMMTLIKMLDKGATFAAHLEKRQFLPLLPLSLSISVLMLSETCQKKGQHQHNLQPACNVRKNVCAVSLLFESLLIVSLSLSLSHTHSFPGQYLPNETKLLIVIRYAQLIDIHTYVCNRPQYFFTYISQFFPLS